MSAHLSAQEQTDLISRKLEQGPLSRQLAEVFAHLAECATCRGALNESRNHAMHLSDTIEWTPAHLEFEQLAGYVANKLDVVEREIADNHLAACDFCAQEVQELTALHHDLSRASVSARPQPRAGWWSRFKLNWPVLAFDRVLTPVLAVGVLFLLTVLGSWWWRRNVAEMSLAQHQKATPSQTTNPPTISNEPSYLPADKPAEKLLALSDYGQTITLNQAGSLHTAMALPAEYQDMLATTLSQQRLKLPPVLHSLNQSARTLKGRETATPAFSVLSPVGVVLATDRPVFRWQSMAGATGYTVAIFDQDFNPVQHSGMLTQTNWRATRPLPRGRLLLWQVTAQVGATQISAPAAPVPEARFQVLTQQQANELARVQRQSAKSHLLLGTLYAQAGLVEAATREFQALQKENPQAPAVKKFLQQLRQAR